jgi:hypothetical protein
MSNVVRVFRGKTILSEQCGEMSFAFDPIFIDLDHRGHNCRCNHNQHRQHHQCNCNHDQHRQHHQCNCNHDQHRQHHQCNCNHDQHRQHHQCNCNHDQHRQHHQCNCNHDHQQNHRHHCPKCQQNQQSQVQENVSREENVTGTSEMQVNWDTHLQVDADQVNNSSSQSPSYQTTAGQSGQKGYQDYRQKPCGCNK